MFGGLLWASRPIGSSPIAGDAALGSRFTGRSPQFHAAEVSRLSETLFEYSFPGNLQSMARNLLSHSRRYFLRTDTWESWTSRDWCIGFRSYSTASQSTRSYLQFQVSLFLWKVSLSHRSFSMVVESIDQLHASLRYSLSFHLALQTNR